MGRGRKRGGSVRGAGNGGKRQVAMQANLAVLGLKPLRTKSIRRSCGLNSLLPLRFARAKVGPGRHAARLAVIGLKGTGGYSRTCGQTGSERGAEDAPACTGVPVLKFTRGRHRRQAAPPAHTDNDRVDDRGRYTVCYW